MDRAIFSVLFLLAVLLTADMKNVYAAEAVSPDAQRASCDVNANLDMAGITNPDSVGVFLETLRQALETNDNRKIASLIRYPLRLYKTGTVIKTYDNKDSLLADFGSVFSPGMRSAIQAAQCADIFVNYQGAMIGNGEVWFDGWGPDNQPGGPIMIKSINP